MVTRRQIPRTKMGCPGEVFSRSCIRCIGNLFFYRDLVETALLHAHAPRPVLFGDQKHGCSLR